MFRYSMFFWVTHYVVINEDQKENIGGYYEHLVNMYR
jgi:hypothetical protein